MTKRTPPRFRLGDRVRFTATVKKDRTREALTTWSKAPLPRDYSKVVGGVPFTEGIIVGQRFLSDFKLATESDYDEWRDKPYTWTEARAIPGSARRAWLIAFELHRTPALVLDEHVEERID